MATQNKGKSKKKNVSSEDVTFHYIKNPLYRQIHVDGATGGITPTGGINVNLYSQRIVIPKSQTLKITKEGALGDPIPEKEVTIGGIAREIEISLYMDIDTTIALTDFLKRHIKHLKDIDKSE